MAKYLKIGQKYIKFEHVLKKDRIACNYCMQYAARKGPVGYVYILCHIFNFRKYSLNTSSTKL